MHSSHESTPQRPVDLMNVASQESLRGKQAKHPMTREGMTNEKLKQNYIKLPFLPFFFLFQLVEPKTNSKAPSPSASSTTTASSSQYQHQHQQHQQSTPSSNRPQLMTQSVYAQDNDASSTSSAQQKRETPSAESRPPQRNVPSYTAVYNDQTIISQRQNRPKLKLADFHILRTLGTGSFGRVHLVQSRVNARYYAVKVLKKTEVVRLKQGI